MAKATQQPGPPQSPTHSPTEGPFFFDSVVPSVPQTKTWKPTVTLGATFNLRGEPVPVASVGGMYKGNFEVLNKDSNSSMFFPCLKHFVDLLISFVSPGLFWGAIP